MPESSCRDCEKIINREIETPINSQEWGPIRAARNFPTRNKKKRQIHVKLRRRDGSPLKVPVSDYSAPTPLYLFGQARILSGLPHGTDHLRWTIKMLLDHDSEIAMKAKYPDWDGAHIFKTRPHEFARLIAKIGYGYATAELGSATFDPLVTDIIRGNSDDYFYTVGGSHDIGPATKGGDHKMNIHMLVKDGGILVIVDIRLFSQAETPDYHVVVGRIDLQNPQQMASFEQHRLNGRVEIVPL